MKKWDEMKFAKLQNRFINCKCFGRKIELYDGAFALMAAYLMGVYDGFYTMDDKEVDEITEGLHEY